MPPGNFEFNHKEELSQWLEKLGIEKEEICLIGSIPLCLAGIRENKDIDFITTDEVKSRITPKVKEHPKCKIKKGKIYLGDNIHSSSSSKRFDYLGLSNEDLIYNEKYQMIVDGYKVFRLELLLSKKIAEGRPKDKKDVERMEEADLIGGPEWNWDLFYCLPPWERPKKPLYRKIIDLLQLYDMKEFPKVFISSAATKLGVDKAVDSLFRVYNRPRKMRKIKNLQNYRTHPQSRLPIPVILSNYVEDDEFMGWDIILEYALESEDFQKIDSNIEKDLKEINKLEKDYNSPITISKRGKVLEGRSTLVENILKDNYMVDIEIKNSSNNKSRDKKWLEEKINSNSTESEYLEDKRLEAFERIGLIFYAAIWPSARNIFEEIEEYINERVHVTESKIYDISNNFSKTMHDLYKSDKRADEWKIENKIYKMKDEKKVMKVLKLWLPDPDFRYHIDKDGVTFSKITRTLKNDCRKRFHSRMENYFHENMIHITENYKNNKHTFQVLNELEEDK